MDSSCLFFFIFLLPGIAIIMSILKQQNQEENEASLDDSNYGYRRLSDNNNNSFRNFSQNVSNNSYSNNNYETPYTNKYSTRNNYGQTTNNNRQSVPYYNQENKLSLFFICKAPINVEKYTNYVIELIDDHGRNLFLNKFPMQISKFKTARVTFTEINESAFLTRRNKTIGQGMTLIKSLKIKFLIGDKARLEISLSLPFTYCISIDNPNRLFNIGIYERASKNLSEDLVINLTRNDMNIIQSKISANSFEEPTKKQKVISLNSFSNASDEELINQLFKSDYINKKQNNNADKILNIDPWDISNDQLLNNDSLNNQISSSEIIKEDSNTKRERINSKRDNKSDDIFASSTNKKKSSYEEYLEQQKLKEIDDKVEIIEEEIINTNDDNVFENGYPVYEVTDENYKYEYNYNIKNDYEEEYEEEYEDEYEEEIKPVYTKQITEQHEKEKEEILSDKVSNIDSILNKYVKSKPKFTTRSYTPSTYKSATSSYSSKADSMMNSLSSRAKSLSSRINSKFSKDKKVKEVKMISKKFDTSSSSSLSSKYLNKYSKYSKFSSKK